MTLEEFLEDFKTVAHEFRWHLRHYIHFPDSSRIVGAHKNGLGFCGCPITCYHYAKNGKIQPDCSYRTVAEEIGLSKEDAEKIAWSADDYRNGIHFSETVRKELLDAMELAEENKGGGACTFS